MARHQRKIMEEAQNEYEEVVEPQAQDHEEAIEAPQTNSKSQEDWQERNWREMRKSHDELKQIAKTQAEIIAQLKQKLEPVEQDEFDSIADDDYIPKGKVEKLVEKKARMIAQNAVKEETERLLRQRDQEQFLDKLKRQYSDFDDVVNVDTLAILEKQDPDLAETIAELKDPYKIGLQSYKYIKALGIADKVPQARRVAEVDKKLEKNAKTVQSPQAYDKRPMAQAFKTTDAERAAIYREMMEYAQKASFS
jgi:hypothetical protein